MNTPPSTWGRFWLTCHILAQLTPWSVAICDRLSPGATVNIRAAGAAAAAALVEGVDETG